MKLELKLAELQELTGRFIEDEELTDWEWETDFKTDALRRLKRLESEQLSHFELYAELNEMTLEAHAYFCGLSPEAQQRVACDLRDWLRMAAGLKERMRTCARKQIARRTNPNSLSIRLSEDLRKLKADFNKRHPTTQWLKSR